MARMILVCGKICAGKSTYAKELSNTIQAVRLNPDELMKHYFGENLGEKHEEMLQKTLEYLYYKSLEIHGAGIHVILDFGFWQRHYREEANQFFTTNGVRPEWHYVEVSDGVWKRNIKKRNEIARQSVTFDYIVDEGILDKFRNPDDAPKRDEMDVWYTNDWC